MLPLHTLSYVTLRPSTARIMLLQLHVSGGGRGGRQLEGGWVYVERGARSRRRRQVRRALLILAHTTDEVVSYRV